MEEASCNFAAVKCFNERILKRKWKKKSHVKKRYATVVAIVVVVVVVMHMMIAVGDGMKLKENYDTHHSLSLSFACFALIFFFIFFYQQWPFKFSRNSGMEGARNEI